MRGESKGSRKGKPTRTSRAVSKSDLRRQGLDARKFRGKAWATGCRKASDDEIREAIKGSLANKTTISDRLKISRETLYRWMNEKPWIAEAIDAETEKTFDWVENKILQKIEAGDVTMTIFFAKTRMKQRGYVERQEIHGDMTVVPQIVDDIPAEPLSPSGTLSTGKREQNEGN